MVDERIIDAFDKVVAECEGRGLIITPDFPHHPGSEFFSAILSELFQEKVTEDYPTVNLASKIDAFVYCKDNIKSNSIEGVTKLSLPLLYPTMMTKTNITFKKYPNFSTTFKDIIDTYIYKCNNLDDVNDCYPMRLFINMAYSYTKQFELSGKDIDKIMVTMGDYYVEAMGNIIRLIVRGGFTIFYVDTDTIYFSSNAYDDKIFLTLLASMCRKYFDLIPNITLESDKYLFLGKKSYVTIHKSVGVKKYYRKNEEMEKERSKTDIDNCWYTIYRKQLWGNR